MLFPCSSCTTAAFVGSPVCPGTLYSSSVCATCFLPRLRKKRKKATAPIAMTASGMPIPIPIFAPLDNPPELEAALEGSVGVDVWLVVLRVCCVPVVVGEPELGVGPVAAEKAFKSELCHQTGIPSPYMV